MWYPYTSATQSSKRAIYNTQLDMQQFSMIS